MNEGWIRVREAAYLLGVSTSTIRRRIEAGELRGRTGQSGRREVFIPAKLRREFAELHNQDMVPAQALRGTGTGTEKLPKDASRPDESDPRSKTDAAQLDDQCDGDEQSQEELIRRYERMAGGSLMLAEQRAKELKHHVDHAYEQLAHTRNQVRHIRKFAIAGWASCAAAVVLAIILSVAFGLSASRAQARADLQTQNTNKAELRNQKLMKDLAEIKTRVANRSQAHEAAPPDDAVAETTPANSVRPLLSLPLASEATTSE